MPRRQVADDLDVSPRLAFDRAAYRLIDRISSFPICSVI